MADQEHRIRIKVDSRGAERNVTSFSGALGGMTSKAGLASVALGGVVVGLSALALGVRTFLSAMSKANSEFAPFEQGMRNVAAVSGATNEKLRNLSTTALELASATRFSPRQVTEGLYALASAGQSVNEQLASLPGVLNFAEAAQADLGLATEITVGTLKVFGFAASEANRVVDVFTASIANSSLNAQRLQIAMRQAGPAAKALNQEFESTTAALAILTSQFNSGELAGTGYRSMLNQLVQKQDELGIKATDSAGNMRPLVDIIRDLEERGLAGTEIMRILGTEAGPALAALLSQGSEALADMTEKIQSNGQAAKVAAEQLDTLQGDQDQLASKIQEFWVRVGDVSSEGSRTVTQAQLEFMTSIVDFINENEAELRQFTSDISESIRIVTDAFRGFQPVLKDISPVLAIVASQIRALALATELLVKSMPELQALRSIMRHPLRGLGSEDSGADPAMVAKMMHALNIALAEFAKRQHDAADAAAEGARENEALRKSVGQLKDELKSLNEEIRDHEEEVRKSEERIRSAQAEYREFTSALEAVGKALGGLDAIEITEWLEEQGRAIPGTAEGWQDLADSIRRVDEELARITSQSGDISLDIEGELGGMVQPHLDPEVLKDIQREHADTYGKMAAEAEAVMDQAWRNIQDIAADALADILKTGKVDFKALANAILDVFAQMLAKLLIMWAANAAQRVALEQGVAAAGGASAASGGGGGFASLFGGASGGVSASTLVAAFGTVALVGAALFIAHKAITWGDRKKLIGAGSVGRSDGEFHGSISTFTDIGNALIDSVHNFVRHFESVTGTFIRNLPEIAFKIQEGSDQLMVFIDGALAGVFDTMAEAIDFGIRAALRSADIEGIDPELKAALEGGRFESLEQLNEVLAILQEAGNASLVDVTVKIREMLAGFDEMARKLEEVGISAGVLGNLIARGWQQIRDSITGVTKSARELFDQRREAFNKELELERQKQEAALATAEANIVVAQTEVARLEAMIAAAEATGNITEAMLAQWNAALRDAVQALNAASAAAAAARAALDALPDPIQPGEFRGGGAGRRETDRERVQDFLREHELSQLSDLAAAHARLNDQREELIRLAHGDAEAIEALNEAIDEQIRAANQAAVEDVYGRLLDFEQDPNLSPFREALRGVGETADEIREDFLQLAEDLEFGAERIETGLNRIEAAERRRLQALVEQEGQDLLLSALEFLGRSEESERLRFELEKASLMIRFEELKIAVEKYNLELEMLGRIGDLVGEIAGLDFDEWQNLQRPVRNVNRGFRDTNRELDRMVQRLASAKEGIGDFLASLGRGELGGRSPMDSLAAARAQFDEVVREARGGNIQALEMFPESARNLMKLAEEAFASGPQFQEIFDLVRAAGMDLMDVNRVREDNVVFDERFLRTQNELITLSRLSTQRLNGISESLHTANRRDPIPPQHFQHQREQINLQRRMVELMEENNRLRRQQQAKSSQVA